MRITHYYTKGSKAAAAMHYDAQYRTDATIYTAYRNPSATKVNAWRAIQDTYCNNETSCLGIPCHEIIVPACLHKLNNKAYMKYMQGTLHVVGASSHFFSTAAIFTDVETDKQYIVKETHCNTYMCEL